MRKPLAVAGMLIFCAGSLVAQESGQPPHKQKLTAQAATSLRFISDLQLSRDNSRLAFVVSEPPKGEKGAQHIWIYDRKSDFARQFTYSGKSENSPRWSPDGKQLAFLSDRDGEEQKIT